MEVVDSANSSSTNPATDSSTTSSISAMTTALPRHHLQQNTGAVVGNGGAIINATPSVSKNKGKQRMAPGGQQRGVTSSIGNQPPRKRSAVATTNQNPTDVLPPSRTQPVIINPAHEPNSDRSDINSNNTNNDATATASLSSRPPTKLRGNSLRRQQTEADFDETEELAYVRPQPIQLVDRTASRDPKSASVWAKDVHVGTYTVIEGNTKLGAYVVWTVDIEILKAGEEDGDGNDSDADDDPEAGPDSAKWSLHTAPVFPYEPQGSPTSSSGAAPHRHGVATRSVITIRKRYSEFYTLRERLWYAYPRQRHGIPELPPKSVVSKFREAFLEARRRGLEFFLLTVLLNPVFASSPIVKDFVRSG